MLKLICILVLAGICVTATAAPSYLRCEYRVDPLGVDLLRPRLSWILEPAATAPRGARQTAYQIVVASSSEALAKDQGDLWDSGKVDSALMNQIAYQGKPMASSQGGWWKVRTWDEAGKPSEWSKPAQWTMGVMKPEDWQAKWIAGPQLPDSASIMFRHQFTVKPALKRAIIHISGLGHYEMTLGGQRVGEDLLAPGWTKYDKTVLYDTYDVTKLLSAGPNTAGVMLGDGFYHVPRPGNSAVGLVRYTKTLTNYGPLRVLAMIRLEYADGTSEIVGTDGNWRVTPSPITYSHIYAGEDYDARLEQRGWNANGFDASKWQAATVTDGPTGALRAISCAGPPIRAFEVFKPVESWRRDATTMTYDFGQNSSGIPRITVKGPPGSMVRIFPSELVSADGSLNRSSSSPPDKITYCQYILGETADGSGVQSWSPKFFYHGYRYLQVDCFPPEAGGEMPVVQSIETAVVHANSTPIGQFSTSNELFNQIHTLVRWAQTSNMMHVMTDCPHREKLGWLEQNHLNGPALRYEFDMAPLLAKSVNDMADSQIANGFVPNVAPEYVRFSSNLPDGTKVPNDFSDSPEWGSAMILVPWQQYEFSGDVEILRRAYEPMKRYVAYLGSRATKDIVSHGLGDWFDIGERGAPGVAKNTPKSVTATAFYYTDTLTVSKTAALLGKADEARQYEQLAAQIRNSFNRELYNPETKQYATGSQRSNAMPLVLGIVEEANRQAVFDAIVNDLTKRGMSITTGEISYPYLLRALAANGRSDLIYAINNQSDRPGYGMILRSGATALTESWTGGNSRNHFMLGQIVEWFYHDLSGIQCDPAGPGFTRIIIKPAIVGDLKWVKGSYDSMSGKITSNWTHDAGKVTLDITIPANTTATVFVPAKSEAAVTESSKALGQAAGVKVLRQEKNALVCEVVSGTYRFEAKE